MGEKEGEEADMGSREVGGGVLVLRRFPSWQGGSSRPVKWLQVRRSQFL